MRRPMQRRQRGMGAVAVVLVLVVLAAIAAAVVRMGNQSQNQISQALQGARASAAARTGIEWGLYKAFRGSWTTCSNASQTLDLSADGGDMRVTVRCDSQRYNEGESAPGTAATLRVYTIDAVACSSRSMTTACPDAGAVTTQGYAERRRVIQAVQPGG